jgi:RHS repeat-associated protein
MEYTPLRQLAKVKDWLGETKIERDSCGNPVSITDHNGRTVRYEWGSMGQREGMIYPDGTKISWKYDSLLRPVQMNRTAAGRDPLWTQYQYDGQGRLSEKRTSGGYITRWQYDETGLLGELSHTDASGILDRFQYTYDAAGNKTAIRKERRGFPEESGSYQYAYDGLHRLTGVEKDGKPLRSYQYDIFGNRTVMEDCTRGIMTVSEYDALNHLIRQEISKDAFPEDTIQKTYTYDKRGNLTGEYQDGDLLHGYAFNSMNRLEKAWDSEGTEAEYFYNALGQRTARSTAEETEEYLLDLTKPYHNLLELHKGKHRQTFYWDMNVSAMEDENRTLQYYLQDELGSPLRVLYRSGSGAAYGYDEFGADLYDPEKKPGAGRQYSRQGEHQPFGFTGYRYDDISGTYFAQAREYQPGEGRFTAEDILRGRNTIPKTLNRYGYCWGNPIQYVDVNGRDPVTPQDIQKGFWESVLNAADQAVDDFAYQMYCIENDIKDAVNEGYQMVKDGVQTGLDFLGDTVHNGIENLKDICAEAVVDIRDQLSDNTGTMTIDVSAAVNLLLGKSSGYSLSFDWEGNVSFQTSDAMLGYKDSTQVGFVNAGASIGLAFTDAKNVEGLLGYGVDAGIGIGKCGIGLIGLNWEGKDINGFKFSVGPGYGIDVHLAKPYTQELDRWNIFNFILNALGRSEYANRTVYNGSCLAAD